MVLMPMVECSISFWNLADVHKETKHSLFPRSYFLTWVNLVKTPKPHYVSRHCFTTPQQFPIIWGCHSHHSKWHTRIFTTWPLPASSVSYPDTHTSTHHHSGSQFIIVTPKWTLSSSPHVFLFSFNKYLGVGIAIHHAKGNCINRE